MTGAVLRNPLLVAASAQHAKIISGTVPRKSLATRFGDKGRQDPRESLCDWNLYLCLWSLSLIFTRTIFDENPN